MNENLQQFANFSGLRGVKCFGGGTVAGSSKAPFWAEFACSPGLRGFPSRTPVSSHSDADWVDWLL